MQRFSKMGFAKRAQTYSPYYLRDEMSQAEFTRVVALCGYPLCRLTKKYIIHKPEIRNPQSELIRTPACALYHLPS